MSLQIRTMSADGTGKLQVTNNNGVNFGPFFYPNDERIIFCSNMANPKGQNFDLWAVDIDGNNLEQRTTFPGFSVFSPDGNRLVFSSNSNQEKPHDTNIFICERRD